MKTTVSNLFDFADGVETEKDFLNFLNALAIDKEDEEQKEKIYPSSPYGPGANGWENGNIAAFLSAAPAWGESSINGFPGMDKVNNPWKRAALILHAGKFYE